MDLYKDIIGAAVSGAKSGKHQAFLAKKWTMRRTYPLRQNSKDAVLRFADRAFPYVYDPKNYSGEWLTRDMPSGYARPLDRVIYCFWTGSNAITPNRLIGLESMIAKNPGIDVRLITPNKLDDYLLAGEPLHPAFHDLSLVHRSDYLRCYFMNFWGGGYCDIKTLHHSWSPAFDRLDADTGKWALGYHEVASDMTARLPGRLGRDVRRRYSRLIGNGAFIMKPQTPLTREWYSRLLERMDFYAEALKLHPGNERGDNPGYPIPWIDILGNILPPVALKYHHRLIQDDTVRPSFSDYK
ncbi:hypothetical protein Q9R30_00155 [Arthrobacter sp. AB6]|uniref:hypothetical protein n=1 Tax=Arthrobacter sp. AB6 TaxID=2962570 RepID=UPI002881D599|nr:hypothetical protein [Arthrobacter sp. AB6]MDT0193763.1 hypothetical protein [Arthrobacter sp. AB6]